MSSTDDQLNHPASLSVEDGGILDAVVEAIVADDPHHPHPHHPHKDDDDAATSAMIGKYL